MVREAAFEEVIGRLRRHEQAERASSRSANLEVVLARRCWTWASWAEAHVAVEAEVGNVVGA